MMEAMQQRVNLIVLVCVLATTLFGQTAPTTSGGRIHCVSDISHDFWFYFDGRFGESYVVPNGVDVRNWGTLHKYDFTNANLLILQSAASPCPYLPEDIEAVRQFLKEGGGVVVFGDYALFGEQTQYNLNVLAREFGAEFLNEAAEKPLKWPSVRRRAEIESYAPKIIRLDDQAKWRVRITDARGRVVMALRRVGKGSLLVASRALCGHNTDLSDPINADWWKPLLQRVASHKAVDPQRPPHHQMPENKTQRERLPIQYSDYLASHADAIYAVYDECFPVIEEVMGVPPSEGMLSTLILLPTGGGGFSSGVAIGLAAWWGGFPVNKYPMVELISHESAHSWVLPFGEPMWNEGIATYVGILVGRKLGLAEAADETLAGWIKGARQHDPDMTQIDLAHGENVPHVVRMAKPMWIFEQLGAEKPDIVARYFQAKRELVTPDKIEKYTADDSVAVLSIAMGRDLFPWFQSLGITVNPANAQIEMK